MLYVFKDAWLYLLSSYNLGSNLGNDRLVSLYILFNLSILVICVELKRLLLFVDEILLGFFLSRTKDYNSFN
jgi:hypothetical protein